MQAWVGILILVIMLLVRWSANVVMRYMQVASLRALTSCYKARVSCDSVKSKADSAARSHKRQEAKIAAIKLDTTVLRFVVNFTTGVVHRSWLRRREAWLLNAFRTPCGWRYTSESVSFHQEVLLSALYTISVRCCRGLRSSAAQLLDECVSGDQAGSAVARRGCLR